MPDPDIHTDSREAQALREVGQTAVRPRDARLVTGVFLLLLLSVAALEIRRDLRNQGNSPWSSLARGGDRAWLELRQGRLHAANRELHVATNDFEDALNESSIVGVPARPEIQRFLTRKLNTGSEQVIRGRKGWLYFRPAVDHLTGPGFLEPAAPARKAEASPLVAIKDFAAQLADRGIGLVVVPTPGKAAIHPEGLASVSDAQLPLQNPSFKDFLEGLTELGIPVYAPAERLAQLRREKPWAQFLRTDSHWTPPAMEAAAEGLADFINRHVALPQGRGATFARREAWVRGRGDLVTLLRFPKGRELYAEETARTQPVFRENDQPWSPDPEADVLILGDSFTNMYSQEALGFGGGAGFVEQLSYYLGRPLDKLAINAGGPAALRKRLASDADAGKDRLIGKRLVIYQFAERELSSGDWGLVDLGRAPAGESQRTQSPKRRSPVGPPAARGLAVWESNRSGDWRIWSRRLEASATRKLSPDEPERQHCCAHLSPDGSRIAYLSRLVPRDQYPEREVAGELRVLKVDGSGERSLVAEARPYGWGNRAVVWRDNRELIYVGGDGLTYQLDTRSGQSTALTTDPQGKLAWLMDASLRHAVNGSPTFSPYDAASLTVNATERKPGCEPYFSHDGRFGFWVEGAGGPVRSIEFETGRIGTILENLDPRIPGAQRYAYFPMLSRDGRMFAFGASAGDHDHFKSNYDIFVSPIDAKTLTLLGRPRRLTSHPAVDRYPDVHVESIDVERWDKETTPAAVADPQAGAPPPPSAGPVEAQATLRLCSRAPSLREISPYRDALMVCDWEVTKLISGEAAGGRLRVAHWGLRGGDRQAITSRSPGFEARLKLEPLTGVGQTEGFPVFDTLPRAPARPVYFSREP